MSSLTFVPISNSEYMLICELIENYIMYLRSFGDSFYTERNFLHSFIERYHSAKSQSDDEEEGMLIYFFFC